MSSIEEPRNSIAQWDSRRFPARWHAEFQIRTLPIVTVADAVVEDLLQLLAAGSGLGCLETRRRREPIE